MGLFKKAVVAAAMATAVASMVGQGGAFAASPRDAASAAGTGTISPGLPTTGCAVQTDITFNGTGVVEGLDGQNSAATFNFDGNSGSVCETLGSGQGSGTLGGTLTSAPGGISYTRTGSTVQVSGTVVFNGATLSATAVCQFAPTDNNPVTTYRLTCHATLSG